jgi:hypothetical protein
MSQDNVETFKRAVEAWNRDDFDAWIDLFDPEDDFHADYLTRHSCRLWLFASASTARSASTQATGGELIRGFPAAV